MLRAVLPALLVAAAAAQDAALLAAAPWRTREVAVDVTWRQVRAELFGSPQQITVLAVPRAAGDARVRIVAPAPRGDRPGGLVRTSDLARAHGAVAAVNGGFFARDGGAVDFLHVASRTLRAFDGRRSATLVVGVGGVRLADAAAVVETLARGNPADGDPEVLDALAAGPWLARAGELLPQPGGPRHPRTAVGLAGSSLLLVTVDGRTPPAAGMTMRELAETMRALGCSDAFNLDGGGSTTMWVESLGGVVNCPCDDKVFDAAGERAVGSAVIVLGRAIWTFDEEHAALEPAEAFVPVRDERCVDGDAVRGAHGGRATFTLPALSCPRVAIEIHAAGEGRLSWSVAGRAGVLRPRTAGWCALDEVEWPAGGDLVLRGDAPFTVDAVRVVACPD